MNQRTSYPVCLSFIMARQYFFKQAFLPTSQDCCELQGMKRSEECFAHEKFSMNASCHFNKMVTQNCCRCIVNMESQSSLQAVQKYLLKEGDCANKHDIAKDRCIYIRRQFLCVSSIKSSLHQIPCLNRPEPFTSSSQCFQTLVSSYFLKVVY